MTTPNNTGRKLARPNMLSYAIAFGMIASGEDFTREEIAEATGWHGVTAADFLRVLRKRKLIYVCGWLPDSIDRDAIAVFRLGNKPDKPRKRLTPAQRAKRMRDRQRKLRQQQNIQELMK